LDLNAEGEVIQHEFFLLGMCQNHSKPSTLDGRNPAPVDSWFIPLFVGFQPSKVVQDILHPQ
jgi:hypothetical protein